MTLPARLHLNLNLTPLSPDSRACILDGAGWWRIVLAPDLSNLALLTWQVLTRPDVMRLIALAAWDVKSDIRYIVDCVHGLGGVCVYAIGSQANTCLQQHTHTHKHTLMSSPATTYHYRCHVAASAAGLASPDNHRHTHLEGQTPSSQLCAS